MTVVSQPPPSRSGRAPAHVPGERLPCGHPVADLLAQVADDQAPRDLGHQRGCPHCRAALAELQELWAPVQALAAERVRAPDDLLHAVMAGVRELSRNPWHAVLTDPGGDTRIAARVVGVVARLAAETVPQVTQALGRGRTRTPTGAPGAGPAAAADPTVGVAGAHVVVDLDIAVEAGAHIPQVAQQVRQQVADHLLALTGLSTTEVNITVVDVQPT